MFDVIGRKLHRIGLLSCGVIACSWLGISDAVAGLKTAPTKIKFIDLSWSNPSVNYYVKNLKKLEAQVPLDGFVISFRGRSRQVNGKIFTPRSGNPMGKIAWRYEDFADQIAKMKTVRSAKFTDNFFYTVVSPGDAEWFNDADWQSVVNNYGIAARIARETGLKGLLFDIEEYGKKFWNFATIKTGQSLPEARQKARQRGQEWGKAVFGAYPDIKIFAIFGFSMAGSGNLVGPFFNGMLDVMPPTATLIEGHESAGYAAHCPEDYRRIENDVYRKFLPRVAPENREKYVRQVSLAPAFYLDAMFRHGPTSRYRKALQLPESGHILDFFQNNLVSAMQISDEYIWLYGERGCWWTQRYPTWESTHSGITALIDRLRAPEKIDLQKFPNLVANPNAGNSIGRWSFWQIEDDMKKGTPKPGRSFGANGELKLQALNSGCLVRSIPVKPGELYLFRAKLRHEQGQGAIGSLSVPFRDTRNNWMPRQHTVTQSLIFAGERDWREITLLIQVPDNAKTASVQLGGQAMGKTDVLAFKDVYFCRLTQDK